MQAFKLTLVSISSLWLGMSTVKMLVAARDGDKDAGMWFFAVIGCFWVTILALIV